MMKNIMASTFVPLWAKIIKFLIHSEWISGKNTEKFFTENTQWDMFLLAWFDLRYILRNLKVKLLWGNILITKKLKNNESNLTHHKIIFEWSQEKISRQRGRPLHQDSFRQDVSLFFVFISPALVPNRMLLRKPSSLEWVCSHLLKRLTFLRL